MEYLEGTEIASTDKRRTQTYQATHDGEGNRLPLMNRSFMSFSYGGKFIEDFYLIVTYTDRINKNLYSDFEDTTSDYKTIDGQYYWGTRMEPNELEFTLSTDWIDQKTLEEFKMWFRPGIERDLILAEHPNRYIKARVANAPSMNMIPFGEDTNIYLTKSEEGISKEYKTKTTIYRGDITLKFIMDEPYWTGILNYMPYIASFNENNKVDDRLKQLLKQIIVNNSLNSEDALKICLEDGIPHDVGLYSGVDFLLGITQAYTNIILSITPGKAVDNENNEVEQEVNTPDVLVRSEYSDEYWGKIGYSSLSYISPSAITDISQVVDQGTNISNSDIAILYEYTLNNTKGVDLNPQTPQYLFYSGTAPSKPIMNFTLKMVLDEEGYIIHPVNKIGSPDGDKSYIQVGSHKFEFTTPGIWTAYNKAIQIVKTIENNVTIFELKKQFREKIRDKYVRKWAIYCLSDKDMNSTVQSVKDQIITDLKGFFVPEITYETIDGVETQIVYYIGDFSFNSKTGEAKGIFKYREPDDSNQVANLSLSQKSINKQITENVGDMVLSNYLIIDERNYLSTEENTKGLVLIENCTKITTNEDITNFMMLYDNMYY